jgi:hypothetical protein
MLSARRGGIGWRSVPRHFLTVSRPDVSSGPGRPRWPVVCPAARTPVSRCPDLSCPVSRLSMAQGRSVQGHRLGQRIGYRPAVSQSASQLVPAY